MSESNKRKNTPRSVPRADFVRDPGAALRLSETTGRPVVIVDDRGRPSAIVSAPRDERGQRR